MLYCNICGDIHIIMYIYIFIYLSIYSCLYIFLSKRYCNTATLTGWELMGKTSQTRRSTCSTRNCCRTCAGTARLSSESSASATVQWLQSGTLRSPVVADTFPRHIHRLVYSKTQKMPKLETWRICGNVIYSILETPFFFYLV